MAGKQTQGDNRQRRNAAKEARQAGSTPSAAGATTSASKQRRHQRSSTPHDERIGELRRGKLPSVRQGQPNVRPKSGRGEQEQP